MQIQNPDQFANAVLRLKGTTSYSQLARKLNTTSGGILDFDTVWLQRLATAYVSSVRILSSADSAVLFTLSLMLNALEDGQHSETTLANGHLVLANLLGPKSAGLLLAQIEEQAVAITHTSTLLAFVRTCIKEWLPN